MAPFTTDERAVDLFAGPGGWDIAAQALGIAPLGIENDDAACATREAAGLRTVPVDIRDVEPIPAIGLIASPPCQTFSSAGKRSGRRDLDQVLGIIDQMSIGTPWRELTENLEDERTALVLEPLHWILTMHNAGTPYRWIALEQVPNVLPVWQRYADVLRTIGYSVDVGYLYSECYGVPQTRKRAVLVASLDREAKLPPPTHSRYHPRDKTKLDEGVLPWVSMAQGLGWGMTARPGMTVTGGGTATGGAEPFGNGARKRLKHELSGDAWVMRSNYGTGGDPRNRGEHNGDQPAPAVTSKIGRNIVQMRQPGWVDQRPATTIQGDPRVWPPGHKINDSDRRRLGANEAEARYGDRAGTNAIRVSIIEAAMLQSFPPDYPWQGTKTKKSQQIGNAIPPLMALHVLAAVTGLPLPELGEAGSSTIDDENALVVSIGVNMHVLGPGQREGIPWREATKLQERNIGAPAPTVDTKVSGAWKIHQPGKRNVAVTITDEPTNESATEPQIPEGADLPMTDRLLFDALKARHKAGETPWRFPLKTGTAVRRLKRLKLLDWRPVEGEMALEAWLLPEVAAQLEPKRDGFAESDSEVHRSMLAAMVSMPSPPTAGLTWTPTDLTPDRELIGAYERQIKAAPRTMQQLVGPSEIGTPCDRCLAHKLLGTSQQRGADWLPTIGAAVHAWSADALNSQLPEAITEQRVIVGIVGDRLIGGTSDIFYRSRVTDLKVVGANTLKAARSSPTVVYKRQVQCYGRGWELAGWDVEEVSILYVPRNSPSLGDAVWWSEPYDRNVAIETLDRANQLYWRLRIEGPGIIPTLHREPGCYDCPRYPLLPGEAPLGALPKTGMPFAGIIGPAETVSVGPETINVFEGILP